MELKKYGYIHCIDGKKHHKFKIAFIYPLENNSFDFVLFTKNEWIAAGFNNKDKKFYEYDKSSSDKKYIPFRYKVTKFKFILKVK